MAESIASTAVLILKKPINKTHFVWFYISIHHYNTLILPMALGSQDIWLFNRIREYIANGKKQLHRLLYWNWKRRLLLHKLDSVWFCYFIFILMIKLFIFSRALNPQDIWLFNVIWEYLANDKKQIISIVVLILQKLKKLIDTMLTYNAPWLSHNSACLSKFCDRTYIKFSAWVIIGVHTQLPGGVVNTLGV